MKFGFFIAGNSLWQGLGLPPFFLPLLGVFIAAIVITIYAFRAGPLNKAIKIVGFDSGYQNVWLEFKRADYRDLVMEENSMHAELVAWIVKG